MIQHKDVQFNSLLVQIQSQRDAAMAQLAMAVRTVDELMRAKAELEAKLKKVTSRKAAKEQCETSTPSNTDSSSGPA